MTDQLPSKEQVSLDEFIELMREPVHLQDWMRQYIIDALTDVASLQRQLDEANDTIINKLLPAVDKRLDRVERELAQPHEIHIGVGGAKHDGSLPDCDLCAVPAEPLCPHGMPLAENICGPCSEGRPNRASRQSKYKPGPGGNNI